MPANDDDPRGGFTLVEVIVAFVILATVLASAMVSISYSSKLYGRADEISLADELAERLIAEKFDHRPGQSITETGAEGTLRWMIVRRALADDATAAHGRLIGFDLSIFDRRGQVLERYSTLYVERQS